MRSFFYKFIIILFSLSFNTVVHADKIAPPVTISALPTNIEQQSPEELAELIAQISNWSYQTLLEVPVKGLTAQYDSLEHIIALRKWLQARQHPLLQLLAFRLSIGVDRAIMNELFRQEMDKHGITIGTVEFKQNSIDEPQLKQLLSSNALSEQQAIEYAIGLDQGTIPPYCQQQNIPIGDYVSGIALNKFSDEMSEYALLKLPSSMELAFSQLTEATLADFLFIRTLQLIDEKRDIILLTNIYFDNGFPQQGKELKESVILKLKEQPRVRISTGYIVSAMEVMDTLFASIERDSVKTYLGNMTFLFLPFINNLEIVPAHERTKIPDFAQHSLGLWLKLKEK